MEKPKESQIAGGIFFVGVLVSLIILFKNSSLLSLLRPNFYINWPVIGSSPLTIFILLVAIFFVVREIFTWYWKINKIINHLEKIEENTRKDSIPKK